MDVGNGNASAPINLTELLEKIKQEQDLLTARVTQLDEVKSELESKVEVEKETKRSATRGPTSTESACRPAGWRSDDELLWTVGHASGL